MYTLGISRNVPVEWGPVSNLQFYICFYGEKAAGFTDSYMNTTGF
jgi:hypothetical protein